MSSNILNQVEKINEPNAIPVQDWATLMSSIKLTPEQEAIFLEWGPLLFKLRVALMKQFGDAAVEPLFGDAVPPVVFYPAVRPDQYALAHPATYDEREIMDHIELFSDPGDPILDPMVGSGTTLSACYKTGRLGVGFELYDHHVELAKRRILTLTGSSHEDGKNGLWLMQGDCRKLMPMMSPELFNFIIFSPPYFNILKKPSGERAKYRESIGLPVNYGNSPNDLGNMDNYAEFMSQMRTIYSQCFRLLKKGRSMVVIVADIVRQGTFIPYHLDTINAVRAAGFKLRGIQVVMDHWKRKNIYGAPRRPFECFHHHYALAFEK